VKCRAVVVAALLVSALTACGAEEADEPEKASPGEQPSPSATASTSPSATASKTPRRPELSGRPIVGRAPPKWLGQRVLPRTADGFGEVRRTPKELVQRRFNLPDQQPPLPGKGFASRVTSPAPSKVIARSTWKQACPVAAADLAWVRLAFWGFDGRRHTGELLVNGSVADQIVTVFRQLYVARFPMEEMRITRRDELDAPPTGDGNNTGAFACRPATGASSYSQHAYGLAVDVNPFQNPYVNGDVVLPELASSYLEREWKRPGMINGQVVRAFDSIGWSWGGAWQSLKDYQHFSQNGR
jgi:hypothetical protein